MHERPPALDPVATDRFLDPRVAARYQLRRRRLALLWCLTGLLLFGEAAAAFYRPLRERFAAREHRTADEPRQPQTTAQRSNDQLVARVELARQLLQQGRTGAARHHLDMLLAEHPHEPRVQELRGMLRAAERQILPPDAGEPRDSAGKVKVKVKKAVAHHPRSKAVNAAPQQPDEPQPDGADVSVPAQMKGGAEEGEHAFRKGCGVCHGRTAAPVDPASRSAQQWSRYFASGEHGRHTPLDSYFTRSELASVKAFLCAQAARGKER